MKRKSFLLRLDPVLYTAIEGLAERELRSVNGQIEFLLREAVRTRVRLPDAALTEENAGDGSQNEE